MIKSLLSIIFQRRHFWRDATFSEVAELYASRVLRLSASYVGAGFSTVFLYKEGYSLILILGIWALVYAIKTILCPLAGLLVARLGTPKSTLISNLLYIPAMVFMSLVGKFGLLAVLGFAIFMAISITIYQLCYYIEFSIVKNEVHAGKEIGYMNILEKLAITISPIIGGFIALVFGPPVIMVVAGVLFAIAAIPLLRRPSRSEQRQKVTLRGFPWRMALPSMVSRISLGFDSVASSVVWGLFVLIVIFPNSNNDIYVILGALSSLTVVVATVASIAYGKIIDKKKGGNLLKVGVVSNAIVHLSRVFTVSPVEVFGVNIVNEAATTAQNMALLRGVFDTADLSGHRVVYMVGGESMDGVGGIIACLIMILCQITVGGVNGFRLFFIIAAFAILGNGLARFPLYRK
jgi:hypothetical protein